MLLNPGPCPGSLPLEGPRFCRESPLPQTGEQRADGSWHRGKGVLPGRPHAWCGTRHPCGRQAGRAVSWGWAGGEDGPEMVTGHLPVTAGSASSSPLEALEACLRGIPLSGSLPPQPPASFWSRSPQPGDPGSQRPELPRRGPHSKGSPRGRLGVAFVLMHGTGQCGGVPRTPSGPPSSRAKGGVHMALSPSPLSCLPPNSPCVWWKPVKLCPLPPLRASLTL